MIRNDRELEATLPNVCRTDNASQASSRAPVRANGVYCESDLRRHGHAFRKGREVFI